MFKLCEERGRTHLCDQRVSLDARNHLIEPLDSHGYSRFRAIRVNESWRAASVGTMDHFQLRRREGDGIRPRPLCSSVEWQFRVPAVLGPCHESSHLVLCGCLSSRILIPGF